ncbi:MAG: AAA family ATPase [Chloroflexi bacterium]|nr:AAA family ATPase [Chloroflexota bacterium]
MLSVSLLGGFCITYNQAPITDVDTPRLQALLAYLILHRDAPQFRAHLAFQFWPDTSEAQARTNLRNLLHHLRHSLPDADAYLNISVQSLQWRPDISFILDVADFEIALVCASQAQQKNNPTVARQALERAVALYRGDLLPSCYDDWIIPQREGLRQAYLNALERLMRILEEQRDYAAAINHAQRLLRHDPLHETTYRHLIRLHALNGDRAGALRVYHTCTTTLQRELNVEPSSATREAYELLLGGKSIYSPMLRVTTAFSPLVGREREWTQLLQTWHAVAANGRPHMVLLRGEAGIGKTRLVEDLLQWANRQGIATANARCYAAEGNLAYGPATAWLRANPLAALDDVWLTELTRLLPEILAQRQDLPKPGGLTEAWQRQRLFEALSRAILGIGQPLLLTIDDLQWCDQDTLEWLHFLMRFDREAHLLVIGAYRPEEIGQTHPLFSSFEALFLEEQVTAVDLLPLDETDTQTLATLVAGEEISSEVALRLYRETEGNPLFVIETVRAGLPVRDQELYAMTSDDLPLNIDLPPKVQAVLEARLAQVSLPTRELAGLAATIGREFSFKLLAIASGSDEDTLVHELDELWQRRIIREHGTDAYDFSHDKLREVAYHSMSTARRRLLHCRVAKALVTLHESNLDLVSHQIAAHFERGGLPEQATPFYLRAARVSRQIFANEEAIILLRHGIALTEDQKSSSGDHPLNDEVAAQLWEELGDILELKAQHKEALQAYHNAQIHISHTDPIWQARLHCKESVVLREQRLYADSLGACRQGEMALGEQPISDQTGWWDAWIEVQIEKVWAHYWLAQWLEMDALVNKVESVVRMRGRAASRMRYLMASCLMHLRRERYTVSDEMLAHSKEALAASLEWGNLKTRIECQFELGFLHLWRREFSGAEENLQATLVLTETSGIVPLRTLILTYLTVLHRFQGHLEEVSDYAQRAQKTAEEAQMPDYVAAAKGNLAWLNWRMGNLYAAEQRGHEALSFWQKSPLMYPFQWQALWPLLAVALAQDKEDQSWVYYAHTMLEPTQQILPDELGNTLEAAVQAKAEARSGEARAHLDHAIELARKMGYL